MRKWILFLGFCCSVFCSEDSESVFTKIYQRANWGINEEGMGFSGAGSTLPNAYKYIAFLEEFIKDNHIRTIVDAGCGDWTFSKEIVWGDVQYLGVDVVKGVIAANIEKYETDKIRFECLDILSSELPAADLLICKDVLMHLSNSDIIHFMKSIKKFKHCLFTNNLGKGNENRDIHRGGFRPLDLKKPPFNFNGINIFKYSTDHSEKQVFYMGNHEN